MVISFCCCLAFLAGCPGWRGDFLKEKTKVCLWKNSPTWTDGFDISFCFQIFPNKTLNKIKKNIKIRDEVLSEILEKCKVRERAEASTRLEVS